MQVANAMWSRAEASKTVKDLGDVVSQHGCRLRMVGSVAQRGWSDKDLDVLLENKAGGAIGPDQLLAAIDAIRTRTLWWLVGENHCVSTWILIDAALRRIEVWPQVPAGFWERASGLRETLARMALTDRRHPTYPVNKLLDDLWLKKTRANPRCAETRTED